MYCKGQALFDASNTLESLTENSMMLRTCCLFLCFFFVIGEDPQFYFNSTVTAWQGLRFNNGSSNFLIAGSTLLDGTLFIGDIEDNGRYYNVIYPNATATSVYGPAVINDKGEIRLVGIYKSGDDFVRGFIFQGTVDQLDIPKNYIPYFNDQKLTYLHSTDGALVVGCYQNPPGYNNCTLGCPVQAFLFNVDTKQTRPIIYPGSISTTAYGVIQMNPTTYAVCGGFSYSRAATAEDIYIKVNNITSLIPFDKAYIAKYDITADLFYDWVSFIHPQNDSIQQWTSHFEGIAYDAANDVFTLSADSVNYYHYKTTTAQGSLVTVKCNFIDKLYPCEQQWQDINIPNFAGVASANSVAGTNVVGLGIDVLGESFIPYQVYFANNSFRPENSTCEFYYVFGICTVYIAERATVSINGCNQFCSGNQTVSVNTTGQLTQLVSDGSCGGCFVGSYTLPKMKRPSASFYSSTHNNETVLSLFETCVHDTNCTGQLLVTLIDILPTATPTVVPTNKRPPTAVPSLPLPSELPTTASSDTTQPSFKPTRLPTSVTDSQAPTAHSSSTTEPPTPPPSSSTNTTSASSSHNSSGWSATQVDAFAGCAVAFLFLFGGLLYYYCLQQQGYVRWCGSRGASSRSSRNTANAAGDGSEEWRNSIGLSNTTSSSLHVR